LDANGHQTPARVTIVGSDARHAGVEGQIESTLQKCDVEESHVVVGETQEVPLVDDGAVEFLLGAGAF
jgi:hypothetical protein